MRNCRRLLQLKALEAWLGSVEVVADMVNVFVIMVVFQLVFIAKAIDTMVVEVESEAIFIVAK